MAARIALQCTLSNGIYTCSTQQLHLHPPPPHTHTHTRTHSRIHSRDARYTAVIGRKRLILQEWGATGVNSTAQAVAFAATAAVAAKHRVPQLFWSMQPAHAAQPSTTLAISPPAPAPSPGEQRVRGADGKWINHCTDTSCPTEASNLIHRSSLPLCTTRRVHGSIHRSSLPLCRTRRVHGSIHHSSLPLCRTRRGHVSSSCGMSALTQAILSHTPTCCLTFAVSFSSLCHTLEDHPLEVIRSHSQCAALRLFYRHVRCGLRRCSLQRKRRRCSRLRETGQKCGGAKQTPTVSITECAAPRTRANAALGGVDQRALRLTWHPHLDTEGSGTPTCRRGVGPSWWMARESITCSRRS
jgi:hypothetical protein